VSYGGREDIVGAARHMAREVAAGRVTPEEITAERFAAGLGTHDFPDPDLLIRTSGEMRVSNFFLWQIAYAEIYVTETLWPDFREKDLIQALAEYQRRERRFGRTAEQAEKEHLRAAR
jgi:undecaprenyl diphosphate synthase